MLINHSFSFFLFNSVLSGNQIMSQDGHLDREGSVNEIDPIFESMGSMKDAGVEPSVSSIMDSSACREATSALGTKSHVGGISSLPDEVIGASDDGEILLRVQDEPIIIEDDEDGPTTQSLE